MLVTLKKFKKLVLKREDLFKYAKKFLKIKILEICFEIINLKF